MPFPTNKAGSSSSSSPPQPDHNHPILKLEQFFSRMDWEAIFPQEDRWKLLLDKSVHLHNDPKYFDNFSVDGNPNGGEPGYLESMHAAFTFMLDSIDDELSIDDIIKLHASTRMLYLDEHCKDIPGFQSIDYKTQGLCGTGVYPVFKNKYPITEQLRQEWTDEKLILDLTQDNEFIDYSADEYLAIYLEEAPWYHSRFYTQFFPKPSKQFWQKYIEIHSKIYKTNGILYRDPQEELRQHYTNQVQQHSVIGYGTIISKSGLLIGDRVNKNKESLIELAYQQKSPKLIGYIRQYYETMDTAKTDDEKLFAIARLIRTLEISHSFVDYNQRTYVFLLLNKLLMQNGFLPVILDDPFVFDGFKTANELVDEVKKGFANFIEAVHPDKTPIIDPPLEEEVVEQLIDPPLEEKDVEQQPQGIHFFKSPETPKEKPVPEGNTSRLLGLFEGMNQP